MLGLRFAISARGELALTRGSEIDDVVLLRTGRRDEGLAAL